VAVSGKEKLPHEIEPADLLLQRGNVKMLQVPVAGRDRHGYTPHLIAFGETGSHFLKKGHIVLVIGVLSATVV
jgi:hypothetical protein